MTLKQELVDITRAHAEVTKMEIAAEKRYRPIVLCRYDTADLFAPKVYCGKSVVKGSEYCPTHKAKFPMWPQ